MDVWAVGKNTTPAEMNHNKDETNAVAGFDVAIRALGSWFGADRGIGAYEQEP